MDKESDFCRPAPGLTAIITAFPIFILAFFYVDYATKAWFFQDDFGFIVEYSATPVFSQLFDFSNFGRFLSRNLYWYFGEALFSVNGQYYFLFNFFTIMSSSYLIYKIFSRRHGSYVGVVSGFLYFGLPAVVVAYVWLSNSQHLLGHFFLVIFVFQYLKFYDGARGESSLFQVVVLLFILFAGLLSNIFVGLVLSLPAWLALADNKVRKDKSHWLLLVFGSVLFLIFVLKLKQNKSGAYATNFSLDTLQTNLHFYFSSSWLSALWLGTTLIGALLAWRASRLFEAWLFFASLVFFLPFAFLEHQRYLQYGTLTYLFFLLGTWTLFCSVLEKKFKHIIPFFGAITVLVLLWFSMSPVRYFSSSPWGGDQRQQVQQLKAFNLAEGRDLHNYCFRSAKAVENKSGVKEWDIPGEWWFVGFGKAFSLFVDPTKTYRLAQEGGSCDATFVIEGARLKRVLE